MPVISRSSLLGSLLLSALAFSLLSPLGTFFFRTVHVRWEQNIPQLLDNVAPVRPSLLCSFLVPYLSILYMSSRPAKVDRGLGPFLRLLDRASYQGSALNLITFFIGGGVCSADPKGV